MTLRLPPQSDGSLPSTDRIDTDALARQIRTEFTEMPGLALTLSQAARFWAVRPETCHQALEQLVREGVLRRQRDRYLGGE
jgi:hypothetical protein